MRRSVLSLVAALALATIAACGGGSTPSSASSTGTTPGTAAGASGGAGSAAGAACAAAPAGSTATVTVTIKDFKFSSSPVQAKVGNVIAWTNDDSAPHSATLDTGACDTDTIAPGASGMLVFNAPGTYTYHCKVHPTQMKDVSVVVS